MFEQLFDALAKAALDSAINSVNVASAGPMHQPAEPENLQGLAAKYRNYSKKASK
mgnify:FL=1